VVSALKLQNFRTSKLYTLAFEISIE